MTSQQSFVTKNHQIQVHCLISDKILDFKSKFMLFLGFFKIGAILIESVF